MKAKVGFGGGCHWCTEAVFDVLKGVHSVKQGWIAPADEPNEFSEAVIVSYDPDVIETKNLVYIHLLTHASASMHSMRGKYRSALYSFSQEQHKELEKILGVLGERFEKKIITQVVAFGKFKLSDEEYQKYYMKHATKGFCSNYIDPKFKKLMERFAQNVDTEKLKRYKSALL